MFFRVRAGEPVFGRAARGGPPHPCHPSAEELITEYGGWADADTTVVVFEGRRAGSGPDGEVLAVHELTLDVLPWAVFVHLVREEAERWS
ncbi:hypothetical protein ACFZDG_35465 [Kitasatospora xanthocidica]|uniref:hypothetical protein n=1 Tax=Kitasatospora xanthocidica TaxID=83382 RepID=UPI0036E6977B